MLFLWIFAALAAFVLLASFLCFLMAFYAPERKKKKEEEFPIPPGEIYKPYRQVMIGWMKQVRAMPCREFSIRSFDGLQLCGKYYEYAPGAPVELMFHGYRGSAERDLCGGVQRCFALGHSALIVDQRTSGKSEGRVITFGVKEHKDCLAWVDFMVKHFGSDVKIILTGISMGASTVMLAAGEPLPENVIGILADCGYTSAEKIIKKVMRQIHLPANLLYPLVRLGAILWGGFDPKMADCTEAVRKCAVPAVFVHGEADDFVPASMSEENCRACPAKKILFTVPGAGHGLAYPADEETYLRHLRGFYE